MDNKSGMPNKCLFMNQQKQDSRKKPVKSLSARNFYKINQNRDHSHRHHTIQTQPNQPPKVKQFSHSKGEQKSARNIPFRTKQISFLQPEHLYTQNIDLKGKVNKLTQQLMLQRVKHNQNTRHLIKMKKEVEVQFEDDKYIDMSRTQSKLIEGVKHQYHKMKQKYQDKCKEYNELLKRYEVSGGEQYRFHCQALQLDNKKLRDKFEILLEAQDSILKQSQKIKSKHLQEGIVVNRTKEDRQQERNRLLELLGYSAQMACLDKKVESLEVRVKKQRVKIAFLRDTISSKNKKIEYLNKLLISKDNQIHEIVLRQRKVAKQSKELHFLVEQQQMQLKNIKETHDQQIVMVKERQMVKFQTEKAIFLKSIQEKDAIIQKLDHDLKYLNTILSYIKTGEEPEPKFNPLSKKQSHREPSELLFNIENSLSSLEGINSPTVRQRVKTLFQSGFKDPIAVKAQVNTQILKKSMIKASDSQLGHSQQPQSSESAEQDEEGLIESRVVKRSYMKHNPEAIRMKQVKKSQLQYFRQELIYRLIYHRLPTDKVKDYLSYSAEEQANISRKQRRWRNHYITLKQARERLQSYPFELSEEKALLLARYIVEDSTKDDLFYHQDNEVERSIAKSILRAFVGEYVMPDQQAARNQLKELFSSSGKNLKSALTSLAPSGTISSLKLMEISRGIQVQFSEQCKNYILSQLAHQSPGGLNALNYSLLFQGL